MNKVFMIMMATLSFSAISCGNKDKVNYTHEKVDVELANAGKTISYTGALVVDGKELTLSDVTIESKESNEIAVLVINGGKLTLKNCKIVKTGDGVSENNTEGGSAPDMQQGNPPKKPQGNPPAKPDGNPGNPPAKPDGNPPAMPDGGQGNPPAMPDSMGGPGGMPGPGGPGAGEDGFNFYGTNSAIVAAGSNSSIVLDGCTVETNAEYANAVFSTDGAKIEVINGITIDTKKNSSRGLYATCAGNLTATGEIHINTIGAHCAALATDRGGGYVTVGTPNGEDVAYLNTSGDGSPSIYSTGDITAYNAKGVSKASQAIVVEGKNHVIVDNCEFEATDPNYGGIMLYQSFSGDAEEGTATLSITNTIVKDNGGSGMFVITNTDAQVTMSNCTLINKSGEKLGAEDYLVVCKNCNTESRSWGVPGSNGGHLTMVSTNQTLAGKLLAAEEDSTINMQCGEGTKTDEMSIDNTGKGVVNLL